METSKISQHKFIKLIEFALENIAFSVDEAMKATGMSEVEFNCAKYTIFELRGEHETITDNKKQLDWHLSSQAFFDYLSFFEYRYSLKSSKRAFWISVTSLIVAILTLSLTFYRSSRPASIILPNRDDRILTPQTPKTEELPQQSAKHISYTEAPNHVGEYACVVGRVDHIFTSQKGNTFLNFCPDYKTCPFGAVIFSSNTYKFPNPEQYEGKTVEITGLVKSYKGLAEIVLNDPGQIKIK